MFVLSVFTQEACFEILGDALSVIGAELEAEDGEASEALFALAELTKAGEDESIAGELSQAIDSFLDEADPSTSATKFSDWFDEPVSRLVRENNTFRRKLDEVAVEAGRIYERIMFSSLPSWPGDASSTAAATSARG